MDLGNNLDNNDEELLSLTGQSKNQSDNSYQNIENTVDSGRMNPMNPVQHPQSIPQPAFTNRPLQQTVRPRATRNIKWTSGKCNPYSSCNNDYPPPPPPPIPTILAVTGGKNKNKTKINRKNKTKNYKNYKNYKKYKKYTLHRTRRFIS